MNNDLTKYNYVTCDSISNIYNLPKEAISSNICETLKDKDKHVHNIINNYNNYSNINEKYITKNNESSKKSNDFFKIISIIIICIIIITLFFKWSKENEQIDIIENKIKEEDKYNFVDLKPSQLMNNDVIIKNEDVIVGIDFGIANSGYAYSYGGDMSKINNNKKISTEIELDRTTKKFKLFSSKASISLMNYRDEELKNIIFIKGFKYYFYSDNYKNKNDNIFFIYPNECNIDKVNIITQFFIMLKNNILNEIKKNIKFNNIKWIFSIPSSWNQSEKQLIKNATLESGINNINYIYESEAEALSMYHDKYISNDIKNKDNIFMIVDAGGYSIDITVYKIIDKQGSMEEIISTKSYNLGTFNILNQIIKILEEIFGKSNIDKVKKGNPGEWIKTLKDINNAIEDTYVIDGIEVFEINGNYGKKDGYYDYIYDKKEGKKYRIKYSKYNIILPAGLIGKLIHENMNLIIQKIEQIMKYMKEENFYLNSIIVTGGFSKNKIFKKDFEENLKKNGIRVEYLSSYDNSITNGAVLYGMYPNQIIYRKSSVTIGIRKNDINNNNDKIELLIKKGEIIKNYSIIKFIKPYNNDQEYIKINVYLSNEKFESFEKLEKNNLIGKIILKLDKKYNNKLIKLIINYNITINFNALYENGKVIDAYYEYYKY